MDPKFSDEGLSTCIPENKDKDKEMENIRNKKIRGSVQKIQCLIIQVSERETKWYRVGIISKVIQKKVQDWGILISTLKETSEK